MTPCEKLGYKVGDRFRVIESRHPGRNGSIVTLHKDDGTHAPWFSSEDGMEWVFRIDSDVNDRIEKIDEARDAMTERVTQESTKKRYRATDSPFFSDGSIVEVDIYQTDSSSLFRLVSGHCKYDNAKGRRPGAWDSFNNMEPVDMQDTLTTILEQAADHEAKANHHAAEHERLMRQARDMLPDGWRLVKAEDMPDSPSLTIVDGQDMSDPANWREGDVVELISDHEKWVSKLVDRNEITLGKKYTVESTSSGGKWLQLPTTMYNLEPSCFRFHHRPNT